MDVRLAIAEVLENYAEISIDDQTLVPSLALAADSSNCSTTRSPMNGMIVL